MKSENNRNQANCQKILRKWKNKRSKENQTK